MKCIMSLWNSLPGILQKSIIGVTCFVAGGLLFMGFSYRPLYGSLAIQVETLEQRIDERNRENLALADEITALQSGETSCIEPEELKEVELELGRVRFALTESGEAVDRVKRNLKDANANADRWRKRFNELQNSAPSTLPAAPAPSARREPVRSAPTGRPTEPAKPSTGPSSGTSEPSSPRPEPLFDAPFEEFSAPAPAAKPSPAPPERGILLPSDSRDPF